MTDDNDHLRLALVQYQTIRAESDQTRREQQSIITWNQAFAVALFGVGAVTVGAYHRIDIGRVIFGLVIPAVLTGGTLAWAGELIRMERTAVYLRALERSLWLKSEQGAVDTRWFIWENFLWSPPQRLALAGYRKQNVGYIGVAAFYTATFCGSLVVFWHISPRWLAITATIALVTLNAIVMTTVAKRVFSLASLAPTIPEEELSTWAKGLPEFVITWTQIPVQRFLDSRAHILTRKVIHRMGPRRTSVK